MKTIRSICVFCGSKTGADPAHEETAKRLGALMAERGIGLVYGGGCIGLMGIIADAVAGGGGTVTGVIPEFLMKLDVGNSEVGELIVTDSMHSRKQRMFELSDAMVALPGGLGTLDETFEIITWKQLQQHTKPIVLINVSGYWDPFAALVGATIVGGFAHPKIRDLYTMVGDADAVFAALAAAPEPDVEVLTSHL